MTQTATMPPRHATRPDDVDAANIPERIEATTTRLTSGTYIGLAVGSIGLALTLRMLGRRDDAQFVGQWVPTILLLGIHNKLVRMSGTD